MPTIIFSFEICDEACASIARRNSYSYQLAPAICQSARLIPHTQFTKSNEFLPYAVLRGYLQNARTRTLFNERERERETEREREREREREKIVNSNWSSSESNEFLLGLSRRPFYRDRIGARGFFIVKSLAEIPRLPRAMHFYETWRHRFAKDRQHRRG